MADTRESALEEARRFRTILRECGVPQVSIEIIAGRPSDYGVWNAQFVVSDFGHHTVSRYSPSNKTPCLALVKRGRSDVPGPLCNGYAGFDLVARIITLGYGNHSGEGGPLVVPSGRSKPVSYTIPKDSARRYAFGWEFEGGLDAADWSRVYTNAKTGKRMSFHEFMARCLNGTQEMYDIPLAAHAEHKTWAPRRKIDRLGYTRESAIETMKRYQDADFDDAHTIDLSEVRNQFRIAAGLEAGKVSFNADVAQIQRELNRQYKAGLVVNGLADQSTVDAWAAHEKAKGGEPRLRIPDEKSLDALFPKSFQIRP